MRTSVLGVDAWGTALASHTTQPHNVMLRGRDANLIAQMTAAHINAPYLPGMTLRASLHFSADLQATLSHAVGDDALVVIASPVAGLVDPTRTIAARGGVRDVARLCKGSGPEASALSHATVADVLKISDRTDPTVGVLSGPSFAKEVAQGLPRAMTITSTSDVLCKLTRHGFHHHTIRVYVNDDLIGVKVGGAAKNVLAIATGAAGGLGLRLNTRTALVTRRLAEMTCLGLALGGQLETFIGLAGMDDLLLTVIDNLSRNRTVRMQLVQGRTLDGILHNLGHVAEGVRCAHAIAALARARDVDIPITFTVCKALFEGLPTAKAAERLLQRDAKSGSTR